MVLGVKSLPANAGGIRGVGSIPGSGRSPGRGHDNSLQYPCLEHPLDRAPVHGVSKSWTWLSNYVNWFFIPKNHMVKKQPENKNGIIWVGFPGGSDGKVPECDVGDPGPIPGSGRSPGEGNGNPLQYSCLENSMDGGAWWATVHGVAKSRTWLSDFTHSLIWVIHIINPCN